MKEVGKVETQRQH